MVSTIIPQHPHVIDIHTHTKAYACVVFSTVYLCSLGAGIGMPSKGKEEGKSREWGAGEGLRGKRTILELDTEAALMILNFEIGDA